MATAGNRQRLMSSVLLWLVCLCLSLALSSGNLTPDNQLAGDSLVSWNGQRRKLHTNLRGVMDAAMAKTPQQTNGMDGGAANMASLVSNDMNRVSILLGTGMSTQVDALNSLKLLDNMSDQGDAPKATLSTRIDCADCPIGQPSKPEPPASAHDMSRPQEMAKSLEAFSETPKRQSISTNLPLIEDGLLTDRVGFPLTLAPEKHRLSKDGAPRKEKAGSELLLFHQITGYQKDKKYISSDKDTGPSSTYGAPETAQGDSRIIRPVLTEIANASSVETDRLGNRVSSVLRSLFVSWLRSTERDVRASIPASNGVISIVLNEESKQKAAIKPTKYSDLSFHGVPLASWNQIVAHRLSKDHSRVPRLANLISKIKPLQWQTGINRPSPPYGSRQGLEQIKNGYLATERFFNNEFHPWGHRLRSTRFHTPTNRNDEQNENVSHRKKRDTDDGDSVAKRKDRGDQENQPLVSEYSADGGSGETQSTSNNQWSPSFSLRSKGFIGLVNPTRERHRFEGGAARDPSLPGSVAEGFKSGRGVFDNNTVTNRSSEETGLFAHLDSQVNDTNTSLPAEWTNGKGGSSTDKDAINRTGVLVHPEPFPRGDFSNDNSNKPPRNAGTGHNITQPGYRPVNSTHGVTDSNTRPDLELALPEGHTAPQMTPLPEQESLPEQEPEPEPEPESESKPNENEDCDESCSAEPTPDWDVAKREWQAAWEIHVYGAGIIFAILAVYALISIIGLVQKRDLISQGYFISLNAMLLIMCSTRAVYFLVDGYNSRNTFHYVIAYFLYSIAFPCLTSAFSILFLALLNTLKMQLLSPKIQRPQTLVGIIAFHFLLSITTDIILGVYTDLKIMLVVCEGFFVMWGIALFVAYIYIFRKLYVAALSRHKEMLRLAMSQTKLAFSEREEQLTKRPPRPVFNAAVKVTLATAILGLLCTGLEVYAIIGVFNIMRQAAPEPWPWWGLHFGSRLAEIGMCVTMSYVATQPFRYHSSPANRKGKLTFLDIIYFVPCHRHCIDSAKDQYMSASTDCSYSQPMTYNPASGYANEHVCNAASAGSASFSLGEKGSDEESRANGNIKTKSLESNGDKKRKSMLVKEEGFVRFRYENDPEGDFIVSTDDELGSNDGVLSNGSASGVDHVLNSHMRNQAYYLANGTTSTRAFHSVPNTGENTPATPRSLCSTDLELDPTGSMFSFRPPSSIHLRDSIEGALNYYGPRFTLKTPEYLDTTDSVSLPRTPDGLDVEDYHSARSETPNSSGECSFNRTPRNMGSRLSTRSTGDAKTTWFHKSPKNYWRAISQVRARDSNLSLASSRYSPLEDTALSSRTHKGGLYRSNSESIANSPKM